MKTMIKQHEVELITLKKGECFMYNGKPYIVKKTYWEDLGMLKRKILVCTTKLDNYDLHTTGNITVFRISRGLFDFIVHINSKK